MSNGESTSHNNTTGDEARNRVYFTAEQVSHHPPSRFFKLRKQLFFYFNILIIDSHINSKQDVYVIFLFSFRILCRMSFEEYLHEYTYLDQI